MSLMMMPKTQSAPAGQSPPPDGIRQTESSGRSPLGGALNFPKDKKPKEDMAMAINKQMMFTMPIMTVFIGISLPSGLALYWITTNLFTIGQEFYMRRKRLNPALNQINAQKL